ncbi:hypothetical protein KQI42_09900 [Tissierella sp. MSJ-40]|uniref:Uncharacterized protein n=1 Tax=Tissierella simiarum TaxID=2841534 RepID=A0ABS6E7W8_9FIRM|nr:hypothetical protein [Tissierella simiarum]MBU5438323.1 hypothetical protein [Tissierella simiarum]
MEDKKKAILKYKEGKVQLAEVRAEETQANKVANEVFEMLKKRNLTISEAMGVLDTVRLMIEDCKFI